MAQPGVLPGPAELSSLCQWTATTQREGQRHSQLRLLRHDRRHLQLVSSRGRWHSLKCRAAAQNPRPTLAADEKLNATELQLQSQGPDERVEIDYSLPVTQRTFKEIWEDVQDSIGNATVEKVGSLAAMSGGATLALLVASGFLGTMDRLPLLPQVMQTVGFIYCGLILREEVTKERLDFAPSPFATLAAILGTRRTLHLPASEILSNLPKDVDEQIGVRLQTLAEERDRAVAQLAVLRRQEEDIGRALAEKEALEAVAIRLAEERDNALTEVSALRTAVNAMTERMKAIEAMLAQEVQRLQDQNNALETVALQLADERDKAVTQVNELQSTFEKQRDEDKKVLEMLAQQLIDERNSALKQVEELKLVLANVAQASGSPSGLPSQMEDFIKSRVQATRSQFLDPSKPYASQTAAVEDFVSHLVEEYGVPRDWMRSYIQYSLDGATASGNSFGLEGSPTNQTETTKLA